MRAKQDFKDVIFTDETTVQLENHSRLCFRKHCEPRNLKQRPKHPIKIHLWGGISKRRATNIVMFTAIMNVERLQAVLQVGLLPFIRREVYPEGIACSMIMILSMPVHSLKNFLKKMG